MGIDILLGVFYNHRIKRKKDALIEQEKKKASGKSQKPEAIRSVQDVPFIFPDQWIGWACKTHDKAHDSLIHWTVVPTLAWYLINLEEYYTMLEAI